MTIEHFVTYLKLEKRASENTITSYKTDLLQFSAFCSNRFELMEITSVQTFMVREWQAELKSQGNENRSINRKLSSLKAFYKFCRLYHPQALNPTIGVASLKVKHSTAVFVPQSDMARHAGGIANNFIALRNFVIVEILYQTGMRRAELQKLQLGHFDFQRQVIKVTGKGNKQRLIPFTPNLSELLRQYLMLLEARFPGNPNLLVSNSGKPLSISALHKIVNQELSTITTLQKRSPHVLRHTYATHLLNNGAPLIAVKELLGHSSLAATQVYTHNSISQLKKIHQHAHPKG